MSGKISSALKFLDVLGTTDGIGKSTDKGRLGLSKGSWKNMVKFGAERLVKGGKHMGKKEDTTTPAKMRTGRGDKDARTMFGDEIYYPT
jgi:hypothetical protein